MSTRYYQHFALHDAAHLFVSTSKKGCPTTVAFRTGFQNGFPNDGSFLDRLFHPWAQGAPWGPGAPWRLPAKPVLVLDGDSDRPTARGGLGSALFAGWLGFAAFQHKHTMGPGSLGPRAHGPRVPGSKGSRARGRMAHGPGNCFAKVRKNLL